MIPVRLGFPQIMSFVRYLTAALLCMHALWGCCWHHAHACTVATTSHEALNAALRDHAASASCSHCPVGDPCDGSDHRHECQGDRCVFVRVEATQIPRLAFLNFAADFGQLSPQRAVANGGDGLWVRDEGDPAAAPLRLHLLHRVLLI